MQGPPCLDSIRMLTLSPNLVELLRIQPLLASASLANAKDLQGSQPARNYNTCTPDYKCTPFLSALFSLSMVCPLPV